MISSPTSEQLLDRSHRGVVDALRVFDNALGRNLRLTPSDLLVARYLQMQEAIANMCLASDFGDRGRGLLYKSLDNASTSVEALSAGIARLSAWVTQQWTEDFTVNPGGNLDHRGQPQMSRREARHLTEAYDGLLEALTEHLGCGEHYLGHLAGIFSTKADTSAINHLSHQMQHLGQDAREARKAGLRKLLQNPLSFESAVRSCEKMGVLRSAPRGRLTGSVIAIHEHADPGLAHAVVEDDFGQWAILSVHAHAPLNIGARITVTAPSSDGQPFFALVARAPIEPAVRATDSVARYRQSSKP
ncbi:MAG: hypothetical protein ACYDDA_07960 [Acidiferrobacteraceae bacterium]